MEAALRLSLRLTMTQAAADAGLEGGGGIVDTLKKGKNEKGKNEKKTPVQRGGGEERGLERLGLGGYSPPKTKKLVWEGERRGAEFWRLGLPPPLQKCKQQKKGKTRNPFSGEEGFNFSFVLHFFSFLERGGSNPSPQIQTRRRHAPLTRYIAQQRSSWNRRRNNQWALNLYQARVSMFR